VERRKELVHTHTFFTRVQDTTPSSHSLVFFYFFLFLCLFLSLTLSIFSSLFLSERVFSQFFFRIRMVHRKKKRQNVLLRARVRLKDASISAWECVWEKIVEN